MITIQDWNVRGNNLEIIVANVLGDVSKTHKEVISLSELIAEIPRQLLIDTIELLDNTEYMTSWQKQKHKALMQILNPIL